MISHGLVTVKNCTHTRRYECCTLESLCERLNPPMNDKAPSSGDGNTSASSPQPYQLVLASEVIEHVRRPDVFMQSLARVLAPGGTLVVSTLNRTPASWAVAIAGAEYITRVVPM